MNRVSASHKPAMPSQARRPLISGSCDKAHQKGALPIVLSQSASKALTAQGWLPPTKTLAFNHFKPMTFISMLLIKGWILTSSASTGTRFLQWLP